MATSTIQNIIHKIKLENPIQSGASVTVNIIYGMLFVTREHSTPLLNTNSVFIKNDIFCDKIVDNGSTKNVIEVTAVDANTVTIKNNHNVAVYVYGFGY